MITLTNGNFFDYDATIRINTVNCVGAMGAGVALQFKNLFPNMFNEYKNLCNSNELKIGKLHIWQSENIFDKLTIINFPTKDHWKDPSLYEYIEKGLDSLYDYLSNIDSQTVTIPALGCGHGGLDWEIVKPMIYKKLENLNHNILLFAPESSQNFPIIDKDILLYNNINLVSPDSDKFPNKLKGKASKNIYYTGNINLLNSKIINIISSKQPTEKEKYVLYEILKELKKLHTSYSILVRGDKSYEIDIIKFLLENKINTIVNPSKGLMNFNIRKDIKPLISNENFLVYNSIKNQQDKWSVNNFTSNFKETFTISNISIFNISDSSELSKLMRNTKDNYEAYYINYFSSPIEVSNNNSSIQKIGRTKDGKPNVQKILA